MNAGFPKEFDVCIVGCGPVGAAGAILMARQGLRVAVLDRATTVYDLPRAVVLDGEAVRSFQRVGLADEVAAVLQPYREGDAAMFTDSRREPRFGMEMQPRGANGWRDAAFFDQPEFEHRLRELMAREQSIDARLGHEVTSIAQDADGATVFATHLASNREVGLRAKYVVACDGASSFVRRFLGIPWQSLGYDHDWLVVDIVTDHVGDLPSITMQVCDPARLTTYICGKDPYRRWEFRLLPGETREEMARPETVRRLIEPWIAPDRYEIRRAVVYQFHAATAERWRDGRVFLAGDAAHQTPPFLGQGLNAGMRDVVNLAWKLPLVLAGRFPDSLLDTYEAERAAHAHELVDWAVACGRLMDAMADLEAGRLEGAPPDDLMRSGYGQGRQAPALRCGLVVEEQVSDGGVTGYSINQPTVAGPGGRDTLLDEVTGPGFAVIGRDAASLAMGDASRAWLASIGATVTDLSTLELREGSWDRLFDAHGAAVVRPDRYVFGVTDDAHRLDDLVAALRAKLTGGAASQGGNS